MTPAEIALAAVLRAWLAWNNDDADGRGRAGVGAMLNIGDALIGAGLATEQGGLTGNGLALIERDDARRS